MIHHDLVIIGGGSAGMAAAISAYDEGIHDVVIIEKGRQLGGILSQCIHSGFGLEEFKEQLTGPEFMWRLIKEVELRKISVKYFSNVLNLTKDKVVTYSNELEGVVEVKAKAVILATGCYERSAGAIMIPGERPSGIITAGTAQLYLNEYGALVGKRIFILGSGDIGLIMARRLTLEGAKVLGVSEIMPYSNGLNRNIVQCLHDFDIPLYLSHTVTKTIGKKHLEAIEISQVDESFNPIKGTEKHFEVDTLLLSIGLIPSNDLFRDLNLPSSRARGAIVDEHYMTEIPGLFSCGNVLHVHDLADYVVSEARACGKGVAAYIRKELQLEGPKFKVIPGQNILYVVPHFVRLNNLDTHLTLMFRVSKPLENQVINFTFNGKVIRKIIKLAINPSEMEKVRLAKNLFEEQEGELVISIEDRI